MILCCMPFEYIKINKQKKKLAFGHFSVTGLGQSYVHLNEALMTNNKQCWKHN